MVCDAADRLQVTIIVTWGNSFLFKICLQVEVKYSDITEFFFDTKFIINMIKLVLHYIFLQVFKMQ